MPKATSIAKETCAPGGGGGKGAARLTRATLSASRSASPLDRSRETDATRPDSSRNFFPFLREAPDGHAGDKKLFERLDYKSTRQNMPFASPS
jgi:hypothetical protein